MTFSKTKECYYCGCPAVTKEHVPPKCLFPERKDVGEGFRYNLITVPSCQKHNAGKSHDDEFLMACLAPVVGNNKIAYIHTQTKLSRACSRNNKLTLETILEPISSTISGPHGFEFPVLVGKPDVPRLCTSLEAISRGLYFHVFEERFRGDVTVIPAFIQYPEESTMSVIKMVANEMIKQECGAWPRYGDNPEVFSFQIGPEDQYGLIPLVMKFYERAEVYVSFKPEGVNSPHRKLSEATPETPICIDITEKR